MLHTLVQLRNMKDTPGLAMNTHRVTDSARSLCSSAKESNAAETKQAR
jgi:hypothetical protein